MKTRKEQRGLTMISLIIVLGLIGFFALVGMKLFPLYMESFKIDSALKTIVTEAGVEKQSKMELHKAFQRRMDVEDVDWINRKVLKEKMKVTKKKGKVTLAFAYRAEAALFHNISLVADFNLQHSNK